MDWKAYATKVLLAPAFWVGAVKLVDAVVFAVWPNFPVTVSEAATYLILGVATVITGVQLNEERKFQAQIRAAKAKVLAHG